MVRRGFLSEQYEVSLLTTIRSITFDRNGKFEIGLKFLNSAILGFFGTGVTMACLNDLGIVPVARDLLNISVNMGRAVSRLFSAKNREWDPEHMIL